MIIAFTKRAHKLGFCYTTSVLPLVLLLSLVSFQTHNVLANTYEDEDNIVLVVAKIQTEIERSPRLDGCRVMNIRHITVDDSMGRYIIYGEIAKEPQRHLVDSVATGVILTKSKAEGTPQPIVDVSRLVYSQMDENVADKLYADGYNHFLRGVRTGSNEQLQLARESFSAALRHKPKSSQIAYWRMLTCMYLGLEKEVRIQANTLQERNIFYNKSDIRSMEMVQGPKRAAFQDVLKEFSLMKLDR